MSQTRRSFIAALAMGTTASAFPLLKEIETLDLDLEFTNNEIADANKWVAKVKGTKKIKRTKKTLFFILIDLWLIILLN